MKIKEYLFYSEPFLLYFALFFPSVFTNSAITSFFTSNNIMINYIIISIPQILLILYIFYIKKWNHTDNFIFTGPGTILKTIFLIIIYTVLLIVFTNSVALILKITGIMQNVPSIVSSKQFIPFYFLVSIITGYREELFFRAYLIKFFEKSPNKTFLAISISVMFAICHISQGFGAIIVSFLNSMFLCFIFFKHKNIHINALSHALYNFFVLLASVFIV